MSGIFKTLINGGTRRLFRSLHCSRGVCRGDAPQEGAPGQLHGGGDPLQPPAIPYWEEPPPDVMDGYTEIMGDVVKPSRRESARASFIKPEISLQRLQAAGSIISIVVGLKRLAWAHVDRTLTVRDWQQHEWSQLVKQHPDLYLEDVTSAVSGLPAADIYILEKSSLSAQSPAMFPVTLHLRVVEAMLYALLNPGYAAEREHRVFSMARTSVGKHFDIMVGGAKTSGVDLVQQLVEEASTRERPRVHLTPELIRHYKHRLLPRGQHRQEEMCDALLQAIAVLELAGHRCS